MRTQARFDLRPGEPVLIKAPDATDAWAPAKLLRMQADVNPDLGIPPMPGEENLLLPADGFIEGDGNQRR